MTDQLWVMLPTDLLDELRSVARANDCSVQELFRRAGRAIARCQHEFGEVPMDMRLIQRVVAQREGAATTHPGEVAARVAAAHGAALAAEEDHPEKKKKRA